MSYSVRPANLFGQIGGAMGKGLAESIPKEAERYRLKQGLQDLNERSNDPKNKMSAFEKFTELVTLPGTTPSIIDAASRLLRSQSIRESHEKNVSDAGSNIPDSGIPERDQTASSRSLDDIDFANIKRKPSSISQNVDAIEYGALPESTKPVRSWTNQERSAEYVAARDLFGDDVSEETVENYLNQKEARGKAGAEYAQKLYDRIKNVQTELDNEFTVQKERKLQKQGEGTFSDLSGQDEQSLRELSYRKAIENPNKSTKTIIKELTDVALKSAKAKKQIEDLANTSLFSGIGYLSKSPDEYRKLMKQNADIMAINGNYEPVKDFLVQKFGLSHHKAAQIVYDNSSGVEKAIKSNKKTPIVTAKMGLDQPKVSAEYGEKAAYRILEELKDSDSILKIINDSRIHDPYLDVSTMLDVFDRNKQKLNERQLRELAKGTPELFNWHDFWIGGFR